MGKGIPILASLKDGQEILIGGQEELLKGQNKMIDNQKSLPKDIARELKKILK